jgi:cell wall-associated NlpC family hydrolase
VVWDGVCESHTDCSGFIDSLLMHTYGYSPDAFKRWFDSHRPTARRYHDAIVEESSFTEIKSVAEALPGDILAIKYLVEKSSTGHVMLVVEPPQRIEPKEPLVPGTLQWQVTVIDSSNSGHGTTDTRHHKGLDGKDHDGLGQGVFRIYADHRGAIRGFAWSTLKASQFQKPEDEHLVIGRLKIGFRP